MNKQPILSLCIPTNGIVKWVMPVISSIYQQGVDNELFEVVVADNGDNTLLAEAVKDITYPNFHYYKTKATGFVNQIEAFRLSHGVYCKMLNHRAVMNPGALQELISIVEKYIDTKPCLYFINGELKEYARVEIECANEDEFVKTLHYFVSWSIGVGVWDIDKPKLGQVVPNNMFPHICLLFDLRDDSKYIILNKKIMQLQDDSGKGGYDLFNTFAVVLNNIIKEQVDKSRVSEETFTRFKSHLLRLLSILYYEHVVRAKSSKTKYTFIVKDVKKSIRTYYSGWSYCKMVVDAYLILIKNILRRPLQTRW